VNLTIAASATIDPTHPPTAPPTTPPTTPTTPTAPPTAPPSPTVGCVSGQLCGVLVSSRTATCMSSAGSDYFVFSYTASLTYYTSTNGGATWTQVQSNSKNYGSGHAFGGCPGPFSGPPPANPVPAGDPVMFTQSKSLSTDSGVTDTWSPANPPLYITAYFGTSYFGN
jgi:hypothetical protein